MIKNLLQKINPLNILVLFISISISIFFVESITRIFFPHEFEPLRYAFITKPALQDQETAFGFKENTEIREVCVYWTGKAFQIEYDNSYTTNNIGLVQKNSFDPQHESIVFVGDSFMQGTGAVPWFYKLEKNWHNDKYQLINLGMMGTGTDQWKYMLQWFSQMAKIKHIFICMISQDWNRIRWVPQEDPAGDSFYLITWSQRSQINKNYKKPIYYINKNLSHDEILNYAETLKKKYNPSFYRPNGSLLTKFRLYNILRYNYDKSKYMNSEEHYNKNKMSFEQIIAMYGNRNITIFHIPQKEEIQASSYIPMGQKIKELVSSYNVDYIDGLALCGLNLKDYYENDSHPNKSGYEKIYKCLYNNGIAKLQNKF